MKNLEKRKAVLSDGTYQNYTEKRKMAFIEKQPEKVYCFEMDNETGEVLPGTKLNQDYFNLDEETLIECERIRNSKNKQRQKIEQHINFLFELQNCDLYFATFNFNDAALTKTEDTRKQFIRRMLNKVCEDYILNIDYGEKKGREHYHAIIAIRKNKETKYQNEFGHLKLKEFDSYKYGNYDLEEVKTDNIDKERLARYITKLTMHSVKVKQKKVCVKKGTAFQEQQKIIKSLRRDARLERRFKPDYEDLLTAINM